MALAKDPSLYSSSSKLPHQLSDPSVYRFDHDHHHHHHKMGYEQTERDASTFVKQQLQMISHPKGYVFDSIDHQHEEAYDGSNFLSFVQDESSPDQESYTKTSEPEHHEYSSSLWENYNNSGTYGIMMSNHIINNGREKVNHDDDRYKFGLSFYNEDDDIAVDVGATRISGSNKRHHSNMGGDSTQAIKKQCNGTNNTSKKVKSKTVSTTKDPQSLAAKNRRERISERLKVLQELVPNGCKVDLVTMLEKAISYVKFLQLQVKVLATDEFWPDQGGKAPEISQVKEAIDAILSSQRDRN